ncbi:MAG: exodeoxyribonuclease VII small subunit [Sulfuricurvum sp. GWF2_44_89]|uniref:Exodeoxyribonuclease VII small subunit n=1 Tax=Sulfuricurvum kujiense TaxID=148813 RepID=A0A2D3WN31_9BACT|nr:MULTISPECIES: exodeoxyribonuclease VII small subunit [Sulfuricurvum]OHD79229.1 MAG: exodeoxyribonuclease VII small subunit [Sulfuricurvum sp. GWF2_44_89]OHD92580.1 MAG: exodeoxyribonuclease VII small subunit [Sulfuricurvum sp. RIFOXYD12_FULL_44_77]OHD99803.1 MAG: exodeoxyribonuclease VII small subunit [Sulfuricurvum sp. RIFOXYD2_FULL_44_160]DAB38579.1 MAG TPA: exodeoxyribonuclease VII small subunit [Sulfuricurvum kujiense]
MKSDESFETKITNAKAILEKLMDPAMPMNESVKAYEEGMKELKTAETMLQNAELQIQIIKNQEQ